MAATGHSSSFIWAKTMSIPSLNESVFEHLRCTFMVWGFLASSTEMSCGVRSYDWSNVLLEVQHSSPDLMKEKKHSMKAAHNMTLSLLIWSFSQVALICRRVSGVIDSLGCLLPWSPSLAFLILIPLNTWASLSMWSPDGIRWPCCTCSCLTEVDFHCAMRCI